VCLTKRYRTTRGLPHPGSRASKQIHCIVTGIPTPALVYFQTLCNIQEKNLFVGDWHVHSIGLPAICTHCIRDLRYRAPSPHSSPVSVNDRSKASSSGASNSHVTTAAAIVDYRACFHLTRLLSPNSMGGELSSEWTSKMTSRQNKEH
jgi:hypothetical protein